MPAYAAGYAVSGEIVTLFSGESPTPSATAASQAVRLRSNAPFSVAGHFAGDPGVFEADVQAACLDSDTEYQTVANGNITTVDSTNYTFRYDGLPVGAKFVRLLLRSRTNAVALSAQFSQ